MISPAAPPVPADPDCPAPGGYPRGTAPFPARSPRMGGGRPPQEEPDVLIGVPRETRPGETRVAATPTTVRQLTALGHDVVVETGAGTAASFPDEGYREAGAGVGTAADAWGADVVLHVAKPTPEDRKSTRLNSSHANISYA